MLSQSLYALTASPACTIPHKSSMPIPECINNLPTEMAEGLIFAIQQLHIANPAALSQYKFQCNYSAPSLNRLGSFPS